MPSTSEAQHKLMEAVAHSPKFAKKVGIPQSVGNEFVKHDSSSKSAGIMFLTKEGDTLLLRRDDSLEFGGMWAFPGGHQEEGETLEECARRECKEESGIDYTGPLDVLFDYGHFCLYIARDFDKCEVILNKESTGYDWCQPSNVPSPIHSDIETALQIVAANTEYKVAELIQLGILPSPQIFANVMLLDIRITGTGLAYRSSIGEHVWRDPSLYLNDEFLKRCQGLAVIMDHPEESVLNTKEFKDRSIGSVMLPYIKNEEVWGIAKIYDHDASQEIIEGDISTSPAVVFNNDAENTTLMTEDGQPLLIEGVPFLLDHIAIVTKARGSKGVWDKGGEPTGVSLTNEALIMTEHTKADAAGDKLDVMITMLEKLTSRMDQVEKNLPAEPLVTAADKSKKDEANEDLLFEDSDEEKEDKDKESKKARKDKDEEKEVEMKDEDVMIDEEAAKMDAKEAMYADAQAKCDGAYRAFGKSAPRALQGEGLMSYRTRLARGLQAYSDAYKDINLRSIKDSAVLAIAEKQIFADALTASKVSVGAGSGQLHQSIKTDSAGRRVSSFAGDIMAWLGDFVVPGQRAVSFHPQNNRKG